MTDYRDTPANEPARAPVRVIIGHYLPHLLIAALTFSTVSTILRWIAGDIADADAAFTATPWWAWLATLPLVTGAVYSRTVHERHLCPRCARLPADGPRTAARNNNTLWLFHQLHIRYGEGPFLRMLAPHLLMAGLLLSQWWWGPAGLITFNTLCSLYWWTLLRHTRLAMWCPCASAPRPRTSRRVSVGTGGAGYQMLVITRMLREQFADGPLALHCDTGACDHVGDDFDSPEAAVLWLAHHLHTEHEPGDKIQVEAEELDEEERL